MKMSKLGYFSEFLLFPPLVLAATLLAFRSSIPPQPVIWAIVYGTGLVGWTLIEYLLHRVLFHHAPIFADTRAPPSFPAGPHRHARLGERVAWLDRGCKPGLGGTRI